MAKIMKFPRKEEMPKESLLDLFEQALTRVPIRHKDPISARCGLLYRQICLSGENPHWLPAYAVDLLEK